MEVVVTTAWSHRSCKAPVKSSPPTNQRPVFYRPDAPSCRPTNKLPVLNLLTGQKSGFSPCRGDSLHRFTSNLTGRRARGSARLFKISPQTAQGVGMRPENIKNFHSLVKSRLAGANPTTDF